MSKNMAIIYGELNRRPYAVSLETLSRVCGMNLTLVGQCLTGLRRRGLIKMIKLVPSGRLVYRSKQLALPLGVAS